MDLIGEFEALKISALSKSKKLNSSIHDVTIGPESVKKAHTTKKTDQTKENSSKIKENVKTERPSVATNVIYKRAIQEIEFQRREKVNDAINKRYQTFVEFSKQQKEGHKAWWCQKQLNIVSDIRKRENDIIEALSKHDHEDEAKKEEITRYYEHLAAKKLEVDRGLQEKERRRLEMKNIIETIKEVQIAFRREYQEISAALRGVPPEVFKNFFGDVPQELKKFASCMDGIVKNCIAGKIFSEEAVFAENVLQKIVDLKERILSKLDEVQNAQALQVQPAHVNSAAQDGLLEPRTPQAYSVTSEQVTATEVLQTLHSGQEMQSSGQVDPQSEPRKDQQGPGHPRDTVVTNKMDQYGSKPNITRYTLLEKFATVYENTYKDLADNGGLKQFKFDCKKAINIPVNAVSAISKHHLLDKFDKLSNLLSGNRVSVGDNVVEASRHPQGLNFCTDLLAKKCVLQGDLMISSNPDAAFAYAFVIVQLWKRFPDFGKLLLARFYKICPYLVPFYVPWTVNRTDEEYYQAQGYQYVDGVVESQDKFLKRMTGLMRLYATILIAKSDLPPESRHAGNAPYGKTHAWAWLASILNMKPRPQITATMIHTFLEMTGYSLQKTYGGQFRKMMDFVIYVYLPVLEKIDTGGPVARLGGLMREYQQNRGFARPSRDSIGILERDFCI